MSTSIIRLPAGSRKDARTPRIRGRIDGLNPERHQIDPKWTDGSLAHVQQLAPGAAIAGTIEINLFAREPAKK